MRKSILALTGGAALLVLSLTGLGQAAELAIPKNEARVPADCGPCGCLQVTYDHHRELLSTYGLGFDPRNYDTTEPHYYFGRIRAYPRYSVDGWPIGGGSC